jgi:MATE family multidrug resistance protein
VAGHQIAANLVSLMFMLPLAVGNATSTLVAQHIGAGQARAAARVGVHGVAAGCLLAALLGSVVLALRPALLHLYTANDAVFAAAMPLIAWLVLFHVADAGQIIAAFVLRAYKITTVPMLIYVGALWGVGLGGGYVLAFNLSGLTPQPLLGATGFWMASTTGLTLASLLLTAYLAWVLKQKLKPAG